MSCLLFSQNIVESLPIWLLGFFYAVWIACITVKVEISRNVFRLDLAIYGVWEERFICSWIFKWISSVTISQCLCEMNVLLGCFTNSFDIFVRCNHLTFSNTENFDSTEFFISVLIVLYKWLLLDSVFGVYTVSE